MTNIKYLVFLIIFSVFIAAPLSIHAALAECDVCGYCQGQEAPDNWINCARCMYPNVPAITDPMASNQDAKLNQTLQIVPSQVDPQNPNNVLVNKATQPQSGRYYTQLGCLDTGLLSFRDNPGAAGALVNFILNTLLFPIAGTLAFGVIIYGAFLLLTAQGDQMKIALGKKLVTSAVVGAVFTFSSVFIINFIAADILKVPGFSRQTDMTIKARATCHDSSTCPEIKVYVLNTNLLDDPSNPGKYVLEPIPWTDPSAPDGRYLEAQPFKNNVSVIDQSQVFTVEGPIQNSYDPSPTSQKTINSTISQAAQRSGNYVVVTYFNDKHLGGGDNNVQIEGLTVEGKSCSKFDSIIRSNDNLSWQKGPTASGINLYTIGFAICKLN